MAAMSFDASSLPGESLADQRSISPDASHPVYRSHSDLDYDFVPLPSAHLPHKLPPPSSAIVLADDRAITGVISVLLERSGMPAAQVAAQMGVKPQSLNQYKIGRRLKPSARWLAKLAQVCGGRLVVELPL